MEKSGKSEWLANFEASRDDKVRKIKRVSVDTSVARVLKEQRDKIEGTGTDSAGAIDSESKAAASRSSKPQRGTSHSSTQPKHHGRGGKRGKARAIKSTPVHGEPKPSSDKLMPRNPGPLHDADQGQVQLQQELDGSETKSAKRRGPEKSIEVSPEYVEMEIASPLPAVSTTEMSKGADVSSSGGMETFSPHRSGEDTPGTTDKPFELVHPGTEAWNSSEESNIGHDSTQATPLPRPHMKASIHPSPAPLDRPLPEELPSPSLDQLERLFTTAKSEHEQPNASSARVEGIDETKVDTGVELPYQSDQGLEMPECALKTLKTLYYVCKAATKESDGATILALLAKLEAQGENERLGHVSLAMPGLKELAKSVPAQSPELASQLRELCKHLSPLDMDVLLPLLKRASTAGEKIRDQDIVLILGETGAGKSTTMHWLGGSTMELVTISKRKQEIRPTNVLHPDLEAVTTSSAMRSETRSIHAVELDQLHSKPIFLCDTPGFKDTEGTEMDIANGMSIVSAVRKSGSVRVLLLVSSESLGDRMNGFREVVKTVSKVLADPRRHLDKFIYAFTKTESDSDVIKVVNKIDLHRNDLNEEDKADLAYAAFVEDLWTKMKITEDEHELVTIHPLKDEPGDFLKRILTLPAINNPLSEFKDFVSENSKTALEAQLTSLLHAIQTGSRRGDVDIVAYRLEQFAILNETLGKEEIEWKYKEAVNCVHQAGDELAQHCEYLWGTLLQTNGTEIADLCSNLCGLLEQGWKLCSVVNMEGPSGLRSLPPWFVTMTELISSRLQRLYTAFEGAMGCAAEMEGSESKTGEAANAIALDTKIIIEPRDVSKVVVKLKIVAQIFHERLCALEFEHLRLEARRLFEKAIKKLTEYCCSTARHAQQLVLAESWQALPPIFRLFDNFQFFLGELGAIVGFSDAVSHLVSSVEVHFKSKVACLNNILSQSLVEHDDIPECHRWLNMLNELVSSGALNPYIKIEVLEMYYGQLLNGMRMRVTYACERLKRDITSIHVPLYTLRTDVSEVYFLNQNEAIASHSRKTFESMAQALKNKVQIAYANAKSVVEQWAEGRDVELGSTWQDLDTLSKASCLGEIDTELFPVSTQNLTDQIVRTTNLLVSSAKNLDLKVQSHHQLASATLTMKKLLLLDGMDRFLPEVDEQRRAAIKNCFSSFNITLQHIAEVVGPGSPEAASSAWLFNAARFIDEGYVLSTLEEKGSSFYRQARSSMESLAASIESMMETMYNEAKTALLNSDGSTDAEESTRQAVQRITRMVQEMRTRLRRYESQDKAPKIEVLQSGGGDSKVEDETLTRKQFLALPTSILSKISGVDEGLCSQLADRWSVLIKTSLEKGNFEEIQRVLASLQALSPLDAIRVDTKPKFQVMKSQVELSMKSISDSLIDRIKMDLASHQFGNLAKNLEQGKVSSPEVQSEIENLRTQQLAKWDSLLTELEKIVDKFSFQNHSPAETIGEVLRVINSAACSLPDDWVNGALERLRPALEKFKERFQKQLIEHVNQGLSDDNFASVEELLGSASGTVSKLRWAQTSLADATRARDHSLDLYEPLAEVISTCRSRIDEWRSEVTFRCYTPFSIAKLKDTPPAVMLGKLEAARGFNQEYYAAIEKLKHYIMVQLKEVLREAMNPTKELEKSVEDVLQEVTFVQEFVSQEVWLGIKEDLNAATRYIESMKVKAEEELKHRAELQHTQGIVDAMERFFKRYNYTSGKLYHDHIIAFFHRETGQFMAQLGRGDLADVLQSFPKILAESQHFLAVVKRTKRFHGCDDILTERRISEISKRVCLNVKSMLNIILSCSPMDLGIWRTLSKHFPVMEAWMKMMTASANTEKASLRATAQQWIGRELDTLSRRCVSRCLEYVSNLQLKYSTALKNGDSQTLSSAMNIANEADEFIRKVKDWLQSTACRDIVKNAMTSSNAERLVSPSRLKTYADMRSSLAEELVKWKRTMFVEMLHNDQLATENTRQRNQFYASLYGTFVIIQNSSVLGTHVDSTVANMVRMEASCREHLTGCLHRIREHLASRLDRIPSHDTKSYTEFNIWYDNLRSFRANFRDSALGAIAADIQDGARRALRQKLTSQGNAITIRSKHQAAADSLVQLKSIVMSIPSFKEDVDEIINAVLNAIRREDNGAQYIAQLGIALNQHENAAIAQRLINEQGAFQGYALCLRNEKTLRIDHKTILQDMRPSDLDKKELGNQFNLFYEGYWKEVESGLLNHHSAMKELSRRAIALGTNTKDTDHQKVTDLMILVFAWWTLSHSKHYREAEALGDGDGTSNANERKESKTEEGKKADFKNYLMQPHAAQVFAIFRLLGLERKTLLWLFRSGKSDGIQNHLVQIGTGEGKSVVLAVTSTVFALLGRSVDCVCYSTFLSQRDFSAFSSMFDAFQVRPYIQYGTFEQLCEKYINRHGDLRERVKSELLGSASTRMKEATLDRERILLIDEVDVFFSESFYGNSYNPCGTIRDTTVSNLMDYLWSIRNDSHKLTWESVKNTSQAQALMQRFPSLETFMSGQIRQLIRHLVHLDSHTKYVVVNGRIGYKKHDGISFSTTYGYYTAFAHYKEHEAQRVSASTLNDHKGLQFDCGTFSFAEIPKQYESILGVTGTLEALSSPEQVLLRKVYNINRHTYMPSVYGKNQLNFKPDSGADLLLVSKDEHYNAIVNEINKRLRSTDDTATKRAVLVVFESLKALDDFYQSKEMVQLRGSVRILDERLTMRERDDIIPPGHVPWGHYLDDS